MVNDLKGICILAPPEVMDISLLNGAYGVVIELATFGEELPSGGNRTGKGGKNEQRHHLIDIFPPASHTILIITLGGIKREGNFEGAVCQIANLVLSEANECAIQGII